MSGLIWRLGRWLPVQHCTWLCTFQQDTHSLNLLVDIDFSFELKALGFD